jgi:NADPH:quinone reductase
MKALVLDRFGGPEVLKIVDIPDPKPSKGELLVRIQAVGLNRLDHYIREGSVVDELPFPHVLGSDAVGIVEAVGDAVDSFKVGDQVIPMPGYPLDVEENGGEVLSASSSYGIRGLAVPGTYAELMVVPAKWTLPAPIQMSAVDLATLPMALLTAVRAVRSVGEVNEHSTVLVHAGASGTGSFAIQVVRALGARVAATVRTPKKAGFVKSLGAEEVFTGEGIEDAVRSWSGGGVDVVIDNLGGTSLAQSLDMTKPMGKVVLLGNILGLHSTVAVRSIFFSQRQIRGTLMGNMADLQWGLEQVSTGKIKPTLDQVFKLDHGSRAHERLAAGDAIGNMVFDLS